MKTFKAKAEACVTVKQEDREVELMRDVDVAFPKHPERSKNLREYKSLRRRFEQRLDRLRDRFHRVYAPKWLLDPTLPGGGRRNPQEFRRLMRTSYAPLIFPTEVHTETVVARNAQGMRTYVKERRRATFKPLGG